MNKTLSFSISRWDPRQTILAVYAMALALAVAATAISYRYGTIVAYGDAESHLNIAKRVVDSPTPGLSQLGGVWLPLPHIFMVPFVVSDFMYRTGLAGSIVSGIAFIISSVVLWKLTYLLTGKQVAATLAFAVFAINPNVLYMQSTPMTELPLICFFLLSTYQFVLFLKNSGRTEALIAASFFAFCASITRYDGWLLVAMEGVILVVFYLFRATERRIWEGRIILYSTLAGVGITLWLLWCALILGDPLYFTNSQYSAKSQQSSWLSRGELPTYHNIPESVTYFAVTSAENTGPILFAVAGISLLVFLFREPKKGVLISLLILSPFLFNILTLYMGQSVIFIPYLTPASYSYRLFNVRYGMLMVPAVAFYVAYLASKYKILIPLFMILVIFQYVPYATGEMTPITLSDGTMGLSTGKQPHAGAWLRDHYDHGYVLLDDFARTVSIIKSDLPMGDVIYVGNKPYWEESLRAPEKYARWIVMQKSDTIWTSILGNPTTEARLYKYFSKVYTSPDILIFKRNS